MFDNLINIIHNLFFQRGCYNYNIKSKKENECFATQLGTVNNY